jgi:hypothetical protein
MLPEMMHPSARKITDHVSSNGHLEEYKLIQSSHVQIKHSHAYQKEQESLFLHTQKKVFWSVDAFSGFSEPVR